jgi:hypothetical protein
MVRLLADENFNGRVLRGLMRRVPELEVLRVQDIAELSGAADPVILRWAANDDRVVLTHDAATMPGYAYERVVAGQPMPGLFVVDQNLPIGQVLGELELLVRAGSANEWEGQVRFLPL